MQKPKIFFPLITFLGGWGTGTIFCKCFLHCITEKRELLFALLAPPTSRLPVAVQLLLHKHFDITLSYFTSTLAERLGTKKLKIANASTRKNGHSSELVDPAPTVLPHPLHRPPTQRLFLQNI